MDEQTARDGERFRLRRATEPNYDQRGQYVHAHQYNADRIEIREAPRYSVSQPESTAH
jgi:hypothetical protein